MDENNFILHTIVGSSQISSSLFGSFDSNDGLYKKKSNVEFIIDEGAAMDLSKIKKVIVETEFNTPVPNNSNNQPQSIPFGAFLAINLKLKLNTKIVL